MHYSIENKTSRKRRGNWKNSWAVFILLTLLLFFSARASWRSYQNKIESASAAGLKEEELKKLEEREKFLTEELRKITTAEGREGILREKFGLARPGEQVAIIVEPEGDDRRTDSSQKVWDKIKSFFGKLFER